MRRSGAEGPVGRAIGSVVHVGLQGQEGMQVELQSQMVATDINFVLGAAGPVGRIRSTNGGGRGCNNFIPVLGGNGTKIAPTGNIFDQPPS